MTLIIFLIVLFIASLLITMYIFKQEDRKIKALEDAGDTVQDELRRSHEYEKGSLKTNLPIQIWIYSVAIGLSLIVFFVYIL